MEGFYAGQIDKWNMTDAALKETWRPNLIKFLNIFTSNLIIKEHESEIYMQKIYIRRLGHQMYDFCE